MKRIVFPTLRLLDNLLGNVGYSLFSSNELKMKVIVVILIALY